VSGGLRSGPGRFRESSSGWGRRGHSERPVPGVLGFRGAWQGARRASSAGLDRVGPVPEALGWRSWTRGRVGRPAPEARDGGLGPGIWSSQPVPETLEWGLGSRPDWTPANSGVFDGGLGWGPDSARAGSGVLGWILVRVRLAWPVPGSSVGGVPEPGWPGPGSPQVGKLSADEWAPGSFVLASETLGFQGARHSGAQLPECLACGVLGSQVLGFRGARRGSSALPPRSQLAATRSAFPGLVCGASSSRRSRRFGVVAPSPSQLPAVHAPPPPSGFPRCLLFPPSHDQPFDCRDRSA
jgi:hypothetical protein